MAEFKITLDIMLPLLMMLPPILLFIFAQNNVIETMSNSGLKE